MPEFILNTDGVVKTKTGERVAFYALPILTQGYIKCLIWNNTDGSRADGTYDPENGSALPEEVGFDDLSADALASIIADCDAFASQARDLLDLAAEQGYGEERAGHDFWLTRTGSGVNFGDRDELEPTGPEWDALQPMFAASNEAYRKDPDGAEYSDLWGKAMAERTRLQADGLGDRFNAIARPFGDCDVYLGDDDLIYMS